MSKFTPERAEALVDAVRAGRVPSDQFHAAAWDWYRQLARRSASRTGVEFDDALQTIAVVADAIVRDESRPAATILNLIASAGYHRVIQVARSTANTGISGGYSSAQRRRRALVATRSRLSVELGREPTDAEVIDSHNSDVEARYTDARRSGMIATESDLAEWAGQVVSLSVPDPSSSDAQYHGPVQVFAPWESPTSELVKKVIEACVESGDSTLIVYVEHLVYGSDMPHVSCHVLNRCRRTLRGIVADVASEARVA